jgi:hypothetical protein
MEGLQRLNDLDGSTQLQITLSVVRGYCGWKPSPSIKRFRGV